MGLLAPGRSHPKLMARKTHQHGWIEHSVFPPSPTENPWVDPASLIHAFISLLELIISLFFPKGLVPGSTVCYTPPCAYWRHTFVHVWSSMGFPAIPSTYLNSHPEQPIPPLGVFPQEDKFGLVVSLSLCILQICSLLASKGAPGGICPTSVLAHIGNAMGQLGQGIYNPYPCLSLRKHRPCIDFIKPDPRLPIGGPQRQVKCPFVETSS